MKFGIFGAGSVGCYVGGRLLTKGNDVTFLGRARLQSTLRNHGFTLTHYENPEAHIFANDIRFETAPETLSKCDVIFVTVKSQDTEDVAKSIAVHIPTSALIISLQNGVGNADVLKKALPNHHIITGMIPYNVLNAGNGHFHCGTEGNIALSRTSKTQEIAALMADATLPCDLYEDMTPVLWSKVMINLNNAINMLSGQTLLAELSDRKYRLVLVKTQMELVRVLKVANITLETIGRVKPYNIPHIMRLPNFLYKKVMAGTLKIDPKARSSMWEDLQAGRSPEIDYINGAVVALGRKVGVPTPANEAIIALVYEIFASKTPTHLSSDVLFEKIYLK